MIKTKISFVFVEDIKKQEDMLVKSNGGQTIEKFIFDDDVKKEHIENIKECILEEFEFKDLTWVENLQIEAEEVKDEY